MRLQSHSDPVYGLLVVSDELFLSAGNNLKFWKPYTKDEWQCVHTVEDDDKQAIHDLISTGNGQIITVDKSLNIKVWNL